MGIADLDLRIANRGVRAAGNNLTYNRIAAAIWFGVGFLRTTFIELHAHEASGCRVIDKHRVQELAGHLDEFEHDINLLFSTSCLSLDITIVVTLEFRSK